MKQLITKLYKNQSFIYKLLLHVLTTVLVVYLFPKGGKFQYEFQKGKPWQYDNLYAPFDLAIEKTQERCDCLVSEFTAAPVYLGLDNKGCHEWLIEFDKEPEDLQGFSRILDEELQKQNSDYEAKRQSDLALLQPKVNICPPGTFYQWMKANNKLGGQHKVPRLSNDRNILEDILNFEALKQ